MARKHFIQIAVLCCTFASCNTLGGSMQQTSAPSSTTSTQSSGSSSETSLIGSVLGSLLGDVTTNKTTIIGDWTYREPAVQFESENLLSQAGGAIAGKKIADSIAPYYSKLGITPGKFSIKLNSDNTCSYSLDGREFSATYTYDAKAGTIQIHGGIIALPAAYVTVAGNQMALTFDATKLMSMMQTVGQLTGNSSVSTLASLLNNYKGMKAGFLLTK